MRVHHWMMTCAVICAAGCSADIVGSSGDNGESTQAANAGKSHWKEDVLCVSDLADDSVKCFNAATGEFQNALVASGSGGLIGPQGLFFRSGGDLFVVNQNLEQPFAGEVFEYDGDGDFVGALVSRDNPHAPYAPRGIVQKSGRLYVADLGEPGYTLAGLPAPNPFPARVSTFDADTGEWLEDLDYPGFDQTCSGSQPVCEQWSPRAVVFGPDGALYVSLMHFVSGQDPNLLAGRVIRFDANGEASSFVDGETCDCGLARPEGLVWGPGGRLYVTSFRKGEADNDKVLVFDVNGSYLDRIDLDVVGQPRAFAQSIVFGPQNELFVPISGGPEAGSVRAYNVHSKKYDVLVEAGGELIAPSYAAFGKTSPSTLGYGER